MSSCVEFVSTKVYTVGWRSSAKRSGRSSTGSEKLAVKGSKVCSCSLSRIPVHNRRRCNGRRIRRVRTPRPRNPAEGRHPTRIRVLRALRIDRHADASERADMLDVERPRVRPAPSPSLPAPSSRHGPELHDHKVVHEPLAHRSSPASTRPRPPHTARHITLLY